METVSSEGLLVLHSSDEFTGGFLTTWGELESGDKEKRLLFCNNTEPGNVTRRRREKMTKSKNKKVLRNDTIIATDIFVQKTTNLVCLCPWQCSFFVADSAGPGPEALATPDFVSSPRAELTAETPETCLT